MSVFITLFITVCVLAKARNYSITIYLKYKYRIFHKSSYEVCKPLHNAKSLLYTLVLSLVAHILLLILYVMFPLKSGVNKTPIPINKTNKKVKDAKTIAEYDIHFCLCKLLFISNSFIL